MKNTREVILERALELFNEKGIEYGGLRELAGLLDIRVSNITYYFATKDHLIGTLTDELRELNGATTSRYDYHSLRNLLEMYCELFHNQYRYRTLFISFVHMFNHHPVLAEQYKITEKKRFKRFEEAIHKLTANGYLKKDIDDARAKLIVSHISLIARFWISEARVTYYEKRTEDVIRHYLILISEVLHPYATPKGRKDIKDYFAV